MTGFEQSKLLFWVLGRGSITPISKEDEGSNPTYPCGNDAVTNVYPAIGTFVSSLTTAV